MREGKIKKRITDWWNKVVVASSLTNAKWKKEQLDKIFDKARKDFPCYECNLRCVFCGRECYDFKEWFLRWIGDLNE